MVRGYRLKASGSLLAKGSRHVASGARPFLCVCGSGIFIHPAQTPKINWTKFATRETMLSMIIYLVLY